MSRKIKLIALLVLLLAGGGLIWIMAKPAKVVAEDDTDRIAMGKTIRKYLDIKEDAIYTLDGSQLETVLANDPRGGILEDRKLQAVRFMKNDPNLRADQIGLLDYYQALYAYDQLVKKNYDDAIKTGKVVVPTPKPYDPSDNPVPEGLDGTMFDRRTPQPDYVRLPPQTIPEIRALAHGVGIPLYYPPATRPVSRPEGFAVESVTIQGDLAHAKVNYDYGLVENTFVKKNGQWYLVGEKVLKWTGG